MAHRSHEWLSTLAQLRLAFADQRHFAVHAPVPPPFGDEGAANHMRMAVAHDAPGVEIFVYGVSGGAFPARQHEQASRAVARRHGLDPARTLFVRQSGEAIAAGAFHNDVVAVANERVLFAHEQAFAEKDRFLSDLRRLMPEVAIIEVPASRISLADAIESYLFNAQLVTLPEGGMALIVPSEARDNAAVWGWLQEMVAGNGPMRRLEVVDVRQSMANGGGPACLRLRVVADPAAVDPRFLADEARLALVESGVHDFWPETIQPNVLASPALWAQIRPPREESRGRLGVVDVRQSMANGGGPACLRLRVVADPAAVDPRFLADEARLALVESVVHDFWPETIQPDDLASPDLWAQIRRARAELLGVLGLRKLS